MFEGCSSTLQGQISISSELARREERADEYAIKIVQEVYRRRTLCMHLRFKGVSHSVEYRVQARVPLPSLEPHIVYESDELRRAFRL